MKTLLCVYLGSLFLSIIITPLVIKFAHHIKAIDRPGVRTVSAEGVAGYRLFSCDSLQPAHKPAHLKHAAAHHHGSGRSKSHYHVPSIPTSEHQHRRAETTWANSCSNDKLCTGLRHHCDPGHASQAWIDTFR